MKGVRAGCGRPPGQGRRGEEGAEGPRDGPCLCTGRGERRFCLLVSPPPRGPANLSLEVPPQGHPLLAQGSAGGGLVSDRPAEPGPPARRGGDTFNLPPGPRSPSRSKSPPRRGRRPEPGLRVPAVSLGSPGAPPKCGPWRETPRPLPSLLSLTSRPFFFFSVPKVPGHAAKRPVPFHATAVSPPVSCGHAGSGVGSAALGSFWSPDFTK